MDIITTERKDRGRGVLSANPHHPLPLAPDVLGNSGRGEVQVVSRFNVGTPQRESPCVCVVCVCVCGWVGVREREIISWDF